MFDISIVQIKKSHLGMAIDRTFKEGRSTSHEYATE